MKKSMSQSKLCRLCVNSCNAYRSLYDECEVYDATVKYFNVMFLNRKSNLTAICLKCWRQISDFNSFQQSVYRAQEKFLDEDGVEKQIEVVVKPEVDAYDGQLSQASSVGPFNSSEFLKGNVKVKDEQEYISLPELQLIDVHDADDNSEFVPDNEMPFVEFLVSDIEDQAASKNQQSLDTTSLLIELEQATFNCGLCGESHTSKRDLNAHITYWHTENKNNKPQADPKYTCNECGKVSKTANALTKHKWYHRTKRRFKCSICDKMFLTASNLRDHNAIHMDNNIQVKRQYTCIVCSKVLLGGTNYREHIATHTGLDIYTCPHCPGTFKYRSRLHAHRKKAHPKEFEEKRLSRDVSPVVVID